jgi:FSR family fosmidomycin resistance protein-like MFS transporter
MKTNRYSYMMMMAHLSCDINQGALNAILPFMVARGTLNYTQVGGLIFAANIVSTVVQPLFGFLGDKYNRPWLMSLGIVMSSLGIATLGFLDNYWAMFFSVSVGGVGVALFHPEGGRNANYAAGDKKATGMSIFSVVGNICFSIGPVVAALLIPWLGLKSTALFLIPSVHMALVVLTQIPALKRFSEQAQEALKTKAESSAGAGESKLQDNWPAFGRLTAVTVTRSVISRGLLTFIPMFFMAILLLTEAQSSLRLTLYSVSCALATLAGGRLADKMGYTRLMRIFTNGFVPCIIIFLLTRSVLIATLMLIPLAFAVNGPYSTMVALGQRFLPNRVGLASGITLGVAISLGGVVAPLLGWVADNYGLMSTMYIIAGCGLLATIFTYMVPTLPEDRALFSNNTLKEAKTGHAD